MQAARRRTPSKRAVPALTGLALKTRDAEEEEAPAQPTSAAANISKGALKEASVRSSSSRQDLEHQIARLQLQLSGWVCHERMALCLAPRPCSSVQDYCQIARLRRQLSGWVHHKIAWLCALHQ